MLPPPDAALAHYSDRQSLVSAGAEVAAQMWADVDPARIVDSWTTQVPELTAVLSGAQFGAARQADPYLDEVAAWQDADPATESPVDPKAFAGTASDGRGLMSLLMSPAFSALQVIASGMGSPQAMSLGGQHLDTIARTQVADAGRLADGVSLAAHKGLDGYVRVVVGKTCSRCIVLAGKHYRWNAGFQRHPHCDCIHLPCQIASAGKLLQDPHKIYRSMTDKQRSAAGWSEADQQALADGADIFQVTNAHKGVYTAGGRKFTTEGTTKRGFAGSRLGKRKARLTPEQIYLEAGEDRDAALRLLYDQGYLIQEPAVVKRADLVLAAAKPSPTALAGPATVARTVIRPELAAAKGTAQLADAFKAEAKRVSGRDVGAAFEGSLQTAKEHAEGLLRGLERFPGAKLRYVGVRSMADNAYAVASSAGEIRFDFAYTEAKARRDYLSSTARDAREVTEFGEQLPGWHPRGTGNPMGIAVHEFGHIVDLATLAERVGPDVEALIVRRAAVIPTDVPTWVRAKWGPDTLVRREISGYATTNTHELIAEAFADVMVNGEAASALSREIFDLLESEYRKGGFVVGAGKIGMSEAAPALSKLTVAKLRELAKTRGIKVPSKALKADIVALLEPPKVLTGAAKRAAARVRQAEIDRRGQVADLLAEMDELIAKKAEAAVFAQRLDHAVATGVDAATVATLRRAVGDTTKLRAAMTRVGTKNGVKAVGRAGQKVEFDEALHEPVGGAPKAGAQVVVVRRGTTLMLNGETIQLSKARVSTLVAPAKKLKPAAKAPKTPEEELKAYVRQAAQAARRPLGGGSEADVSLLEFADGTKIVEKIYGRRTNLSAADARSTADAEELAGLVLKAVGVRTPAIARPRRSGRFYMEWMEGRGGDDVVPWGGDTPLSLINSDDGRLIGLADAIMRNSDRHTGNWILDPGGHLVAIDHGFAFANTRLAGGNSTFGAYFISQNKREGRGVRATNDMSPDDMATIRHRLSALRLEFERLGHGSWFENMMATLAEIESGATGTGSRLGQ